MLTYPSYANELPQQKTLLTDQKACSTLGHAILKTRLILFIIDTGFHRKGENTQKNE